MKAKIISLLRRYAPAIAAMVVRKLQEKKSGKRRTY